jgi:hypothetical protein
MSSLNNANASRTLYSGEVDTVQLRTRLETALPDSSRPAANKPNWSNLLFAAKVAYGKGYKSDALRLYKAGLIAASRAMEGRDELIEFLTVNVWTSPNAQ